LMRATGQSEEVIALAEPFLGVLMWACVPAVLASLLRTVVSTLGRPYIGTAINGLAVGINALGNYTFVFGKFGAPALGLTGSALSSVVTAVFMLTAYCAVIRTDRRLRRYRLAGRWWYPDLPRFVDVLRIGLPITATIIAEAGMFNGAAFLMGRIGEVELAAHTVALQFAAFAFQVPFGVGQAATIRVGLAFGTRDNAAITRAGQVATMLGVGFMGLTASIMLFFPHLILSIYLDPDAPANARLVVLATQYIVIAAAFQLFDGAQVVGGALLRGVQDTRVPMNIALFGYWIPGIGTAVWLGLYTPLQGIGVWIGLMTGLAVVAAMILWRWHRRASLGLLPS